MSEEPQREPDAEFVSGALDGIAFWICPKDCGCAPNECRADTL